MDKVIKNIDKHPNLKLDVIEYDLKAISNKTFPLDFNPDLTFIDIETIKGQYLNIYTLIHKSNMIVVVGEDDQLDQFPFESLSYYISYHSSFKIFSNWMTIARENFQFGQAHIPNFSSDMVCLSGLKKGQVVHLATEHIVSLRVVNGMCFVATEAETFICNHTLAELYSSFRNPSYTPITDDIIINLDKLNSFQSDILKMANGENILIGSRFRANFFNLIRKRYLGSKREIEELRKFFYSVDEDYNAKFRKGKLTVHPFFRT